jgi:hypothetical protein
MTALLTERFMTALARDLRQAMPSLARSRRDSTFARGSE